MGNCRIPLHILCVLAVLGPQEAVQLFTQRVRGALYDQRETARRALLHQQGEFLAAIHQHEAVARHNLANTLTRNDEGHIYNVQMHVPQLEDARFFHRQRELLARFSQEANQALEDKPSCNIHSEDATQQRIPEYAVPHQHLTGLVQETQQYREMFEESRAAQSAVGPEIDGLRQGTAELPREVRH